MVLMILVNIGMVTRNIDPRNIYIGQAYAPEGLAVTGLAAMAVPDVRDLVVRALATWSTNWHCKPDEMGPLPYVAIIQTN